MTSIRRVLTIRIDSPHQYRGNIVRMVEALSYSSEILIQTVDIRMLSDFTEVVNLVAVYSLLFLTLIILLYIHIKETKYGAARLVIMNSNKACQSAKPGFLDNY